MRPNIIIFMTDHQRGDTIVEGSPVKTPNIDRFRGNAVTFTDSYCTAPHCCPSRASFFSGLYPSEHGVWNNVNVSNCLSRGLYDGVRLFSQDLSDHGYKVYLTGKWHVSSEQGPEQFQIETLYHNSTYHTYPKKPDISEWKAYFYEEYPMNQAHNERKKGEIVRPGYPPYSQYGIDEHPFHDDEVVMAAVEKIPELKRQGVPYFLFVGPLGPHDPYYVPERFLKMYDPQEVDLPESFSDSMEDKPALYRRTKDRFSQLSEVEQKESIRHFYAFCSYEDWLFGKLLDAVGTEALESDTVIFYLSDHGDYIGSHGLWAKGLPCFKEAYHICAMAGGMGVRRPGRIENAPVSITDFAPTILEMAGISAGRSFSGQSLVSFLKDEPVDNWRTESYSQTNGNEIYGIQRAVWNQKWKYVFNTFDYDELYDLEADPHEIKNLLHGISCVEMSVYGPVVKTLSKKMWRFAFEHKDNCVNPYIMTALAPFGPGIIREE